MGHAGHSPAVSAEGWLSLVRSIARTMSKALPAVVEMDDLVHDGVVGLLEALGRFDPARGVDFRTYATYRIRGAILDGLRARDPLPRSVRRALKSAERSSPDGTDQSSGKSPYLVALPFTQVVGLDDIESLAEAGADPEERILAQELLADLHGALLALPSRDRNVLYLRFSRGMRLREVAARYGVSITRAAELQDRAIRRVRVALDVPRPRAYSPNGRPRRKRKAPLPAEESIAGESIPSG